MLFSRLTYSLPALTLILATAFPAAAQDAVTPLPSVMVLDNTEKVWSLQLSAKARLVVEKGDVVINSVHQHALWNANSAMEVRAGDIKVAGGVQELGRVSFAPRPRTGTAQTADPLPKIEVAPPALVSNSKLFLRGDEVTLRPGIYTGGIFSGGARNIKMEPGVYVMNGGDFFLSNANITGEGITVVLSGEKPGMFWTAADTKLDLAPPTDGPLKGIVILSRATGWNKVQIGNTTGQIKGLIYAPAAGVAFTHDSKVTIDRVICANFSAAGGELTVTGAEVPLAVQPIAPAEAR